MEVETPQFRCVLKEEFQSIFSKLIKCVAKVNMEMRWIWNKDSFDMKVVTLEATAFLELTFLPNSFQEYKGPEESQTIYVNSKRLQNVCSPIFNEATSVEIILNLPTQLIFNLTINENTITSRTVQLEDSDENAGREASFSNHAKIRFDGANMYELLKRCPSDTEFIRILIDNNKSMELHTCNKKNKSNDNGICTHICFDLDMCDFPRDLEIARVTVQFNEFKHIMNLAKDLQVSPILYIRNPADESYVHFKYLQYVNVLYTLAGLVEDDDDEDEENADSVSRSNTNTNRRKIADEEESSYLSTKR